MENDKKELTSGEIIKIYYELPFTFINNENMEQNNEEVEKLIKRLKENPKLSLYDYQLTDIVRHLLIKVEELELKLK